MNPLEYIIINSTNGYLYTPLGTCLGKFYRPKPISPQGGNAFDQISTEVKPLSPVDVPNLQLFPYVLYSGGGAASTDTPAVTTWRAAYATAIAAVAKMIPTWIQLFLKNKDVAFTDINNNLCFGNSVIGTPTTAVQGKTQSTAWVLSDTLTNAQAAPGDKQLRPLPLQYPKDTNGQPILSYQQVLWTLTNQVVSQYYAENLDGGKWINNTKLPTAYTPSSLCNPYRWIGMLRAADPTSPWLISPYSYTQVGTMSSTTATLSAPVALPASAGYMPLSTMRDIFPTLVDTTPIQNDLLYIGMALANAMVGNLFFYTDAKDNIYEPLQGQQVATNVAQPGHPLSYNWISGSSGNAPQAGSYPIYKWNTVNMPAPQLPQFQSQMDLFNAMNVAARSAWEGTGLDKTMHRLMGLSVVSVANAPSSSLTAPPPTPDQVSNAAPPASSAAQSSNASATSVAAGAPSAILPPSSATTNSTGAADASVAADASTTANTVAPPTGLDAWYFGYTLRTWLYALLAIVVGTVGGYYWYKNKKEKMRGASPLTVGKQENATPTDTPTDATPTETTTETPVETSED